MRSSGTQTVLGLAAALVATTSEAIGQAPPSYDFNFATVGAVGNAPWTGQDPFGLMYGRGRVDYGYRISSLEVTTSQWLEFVNTFSVQPELLKPGGPQFVWGPGIWWGAVRDSTYSGPGIRHRLLQGLPDAGLVPVNGVSWREGALFCNWLNNGKPSEWSAIQNGAYDASTFTTNPNGTFNDQRTHNPGALFWIPTLDEWLKAAHYDPDRYGPGQAGWWDYSHRSNEAPVPGVPGQGQTTAGLTLPNFGELDVPLGAYPNVRSPWGLLDTSGGAAEWTEEVWAQQARVFDGTWAGITFPDLDNAWTFGADGPGAHGSGLRIASVIPEAGTPLSILILLWRPLRRRRTCARCRQLQCWRFSPWFVRSREHKERIRETSRFPGST